MASRFVCFLLVMVLLLTTAIPALSDEQIPTTNVYGDYSGEVVRVASMAGNFEADGISKLMQSFFDETGITVEFMNVYTNTGWAGYFQKLQTMIASGQLPDLNCIATEGFALFRDSNMLTPLNDLAEKYPDFAALVSDNHPKLVAPFIEDGKQYGIVPGWNNVCMHINTNMLKDAGLEMPEKEWTLDTLLEYAQAMTKTREDGVKVYGLQVPESYFLLSGWFFNAGGSIFNEDYTECTLDSPEIIELMQFFQDCIYKYEVAPQQALAGSFINDQIGMYSAGRWPLVTYLESGFDGVALQYLPTIKTNEVVFGCALFTVYSNAVNPDAAYKLACWIGRPEGQELISAKTGIPSSTSVMEKLVRNQPVPENSYIFVDSADIARSVETPTIYADADAVLSRYVSLLYANEIDAKTAMESAAQEIDMLLQGF